MEKTINDSKLYYLINVIKNGYVENIEVSNNTIVVTKKGESNSYTFNYPNATNSTSGLLSAENYIKLNSIASGAEVNQNAFTAIKFNDNAVVADTKSDILNLTSGKNVTFGVDGDTESIVIGVDVTTDLTKSGAIPDAKIIGDALSEKQPIGDYILRNEMPTIDDIDNICGTTTQVVKSSEVIF